MTANHIEQPSADICLVLMFKAPERSKRRLATQIGALAATAADHLCRCALEDMREWSGSICFAAADEADSGWLVSCLGVGDLIVLQQGTNLGERINHVNRTLWSRGFSRQIFIGIDCPQLDASYLRRAALELMDNDVILGPAADGGVVLMGTQQRWPDLSKLPWSSDNLMAELARLCEAQDWTTVKLEPLVDVDSVEDLTRIGGLIRHDTRPARRAFSAWLSRQGNHLHPPS